VARAGLSSLRLQSSSGGAGLGAFVGVYTPTVLTTLGVILYLRLGWVVGHAGLWQTLVIVVLANAIRPWAAVRVSFGHFSAAGVEDLGVCFLNRRR